MPSYRIVRVADELHYAELWIWQRPGVDPHRIGYEFLSMMRDGQPPPGWKKTWPEILREGGEAFRAATGALPMNHPADTAERVGAIRERLAELVAELGALREELDSLLAARLGDRGEAERRAGRLH
jgi:hypothetical protein